MSHGSTRPPARQFHHILIIDDSARIRQTLADLIVANCLATGKIYRVFHSDKEGKFTQNNEISNPGMLLLDGIGPLESSVIDEFVIYTAPSPKQALFVINSPLFTRLTIISDVMMPSDMDVGLIGMLEAIARRNLPVNLVFASSDAQNIFVVTKLVEAGKAYFLVKQGSVWENLSKALVRRTDSFRFKTITPLDFEGMQKLAGPTARLTTLDTTPPPPRSVELRPTFGSFLPPAEAESPPVRSNRIELGLPVAPPIPPRRATAAPPMPAWEPVNPELEKPGGTANLAASGGGLPAHSSGPTPVQSGPVNPALPPLPTPQKPASRFFRLYLWFVRALKRL
jgi:CheY-like chemotaxis protein